MTSPHSFPFSNPAMPGDAVSVLVLVEDSGQMAAKWPDVRDSYLPILLENLRTADPSVQVRFQPPPPLSLLIIRLLFFQIEVRWLTTSSPSLVATHFIQDAAECRNLPDLPLGQGPNTKISPMVIHNAIKVCSFYFCPYSTLTFPLQILSASLRGQSATRHFILVAATGPPTSSPMNEATPSGFDPWDDIALVLKQV